MTSKVNVGDCFLVPSGPTGHHMFVVCTAVSQDGQHLLISVSTTREGRYYDPACELEAGCHPFIKAKSHVVYSKPEIRTPELIDRCLSSGVFIRKPPLSPEVMERVLDGFDRSDRTRPWVLEMLRACQ